ncbi:MAG: hypothetical protein JSV91_10565 [Phycisphaerales bacterium]|nr:MAG: hypothetical protein JSV91_10565 [Phycisphaerales bacterium]
MRRRINNRWSLAAREFFFRLCCSHKQGEKPNILLHCMPRSGSTWILNTVSAHPGMRYIGRPFMTALNSRWRGSIPDLTATYNDGPDHDIGHFIHFEGEELKRFEEFARRIVMAQWHIYPTLHFRAPYFNRKTDRVILQVHTIFAMCQWFHETFPVNTALLLRHPIPNALSIIARDWRDEGAAYLHHPWFVDTHLTGAQVDLGRKILAEGSLLERHVLDGSLRTLVPLRAIESGEHPDWLLVTYEQLTLEPEKVVGAMSRYWDLPDVGAMMRQVRLPSRTVSADTAGKVTDPDYLLKRWRSKIGKDEERRVMRIPAAMGIDIYECDSFMPAAKALH